MLRLTACSTGMGQPLPSQAPRVHEPMGDRARSVWTQATASHGGDQEHVHPAVLRGRLVEPHLQVSDRLTVMHHYVRVNVRTGEPEDHLLARERSRPDTELPRGPRATR